MSTEMIVLIIALVAVALLGPAAGYFFAVRKRRKGGADNARASGYAPGPPQPMNQVPHWVTQGGFGAVPPPPVRQTPLPRPTPGLTPQAQGPTPLQSSGPAQPPAQASRPGPAPGVQPPVQHQPAPPSGSAQPPVQPSRPGPTPGTVQSPVQHQPHAAPSGYGQPPVQRPQMTHPAGRSSRSGPNRFAQEPPIFGDEAGSWQPSTEVAPSAPANLPAGGPTRQAPALPPQAPALPPPPEEAPVPEAPTQANQQPPTSTEDRQPAVSNPETAGRPPQDPPSAPEFRSVSDVMDLAQVHDLSWLGNVSAGRRVRLRRLGYDAPEKLANLRGSEVRRLARELDVSEEDIREQWVPAARTQLKMLGKS